MEKFKVECKDLLMQILQNTNREGGASHASRNGHPLRIKTTEEASDFNMKLEDEAHMSEMV